MVIDLQAEREIRKLEKRFNPSLAGDLCRQAAAYAVIGAAFTILGAAVAWAIVLNQGK